MRLIKSIYSAKKINMGGIVLDQPLPVDDLEMIDPFLLIHHWKDELPGDQRQREVGVGPHPHRGFSPVTLIYHGDIHHRDSFGHDSIVAAGGVQWMLAGKGVTHSERPSATLAKQGGTFEIIQFWVNLPAEHKMSMPEYHARQLDEIPVFHTERVHAVVIHGVFQGIKGAIDTVHNVTVVNISMKKYGELTFDLPTDHVAAIYQLDGSLSVQENAVTSAKTLYEFGTGESKEVRIQASENSRILLLHGKPILEKVAQYGPFVMTNQTEIMQAIRDSQMGKMGVLIEDGV